MTLGRDFGNDGRGRVAASTGDERVVVNPPDSLDGRARRSRVVARPTPRERRSAVTARVAAAAAGCRRAWRSRLRVRAARHVRPTRRRSCRRRSRRSADWKTGAAGRRSCCAARGGRSSAIRSSNALEETDRRVEPDAAGGAQAQFAQARALGRRRAGRRATRRSPRRRVDHAGRASRATAPASTAHERFADFVLPVDVVVRGRRLGPRAAQRRVRQPRPRAGERRRSRGRRPQPPRRAGARLLRSCAASTPSSEILDDAVAAYERALELTRNRFSGGIASQADVALAETQLETTRAQAVDLGVAARGARTCDRGADRPAAVGLRSWPSSPLDEPAARGPAGLPSDLLERRPDIAAAERRVAAAERRGRRRAGGVLSRLLPDRHRPASRAVARQAG